jgi:hypothetical protein
VARLRKELDGEIVVYGSRHLSHALIGMGLVDQLPAPMTTRDLLKSTPTGLSWRNCWSPTLRCLCFATSISGS